jgi:hypothetical protein
MGTVRENNGQTEMPADALGPTGPDSGGQSGDGQGLSPTADSGAESVEELADSGQSFEADVITGVEDAADHPERPVHTHENLAGTGGR